MYAYARGAGISASKLDKIIKKLRPSDKDRIVDNYHYLMDENSPVDERIKAVVCLMPMTADFPIDLIIMQLLKGPTIPVSKDYEHTLCKYALYILENCEQDDVTRCVDFMKEHKHCPEKYKTQFNMLICLMQQTVDYFKLNTDNVELDKMFYWVKKFVDAHTR